MDQYLSKIGYGFWETSITLAPDLEKVVNSDFVSDNDCVVLKEVARVESNPVLDSSLKKCEWEDFENHFHPDFAYIETENEIDYLRAALECAKRLANRLSVAFPEFGFRIIVAFDETVYENGEVEFYGSSTVRFHKIRKDCEYSMRTDDLDKILLNAVLEIALP